ncbi:MAG: glycosyltransferase family 1 protein [bacterium]|nr:glycosyltransferase family 1 protein [bacterium]
MRIGIDARFYGSLGKGLGRYTERLITYLEQLAPPDEFVVFLRQENWEHYKPVNPHFTKQLADFRWYSLAEQRELPKLVRRAGIDLMHYPHFNVPLLSPTPFIVTIHDLILTHFPTRRATTLGPLTYWVKQLAYRVTLSRAVSRAAHILTVSNFTKQDIQQYFGYDPKKVTVTYEAVDSFPAPATDDAALVQGAGIAGRYLLYVGNAYPHKNLEQFVAFLKALPPQHADLSLVVVCKPDYFLERFRQQVADAGLLRRVIFPGYVDDATLGALYRNAHAYIFPSLYEGFGLPPLEAMAQGTPVLSSNAACMPEVLGDAVLYFNPQDVRGMLAALERLDDSAFREAQVRAGKQWIQRYSWRALAEQTLAVYHKVPPHHA